MNRTRLPTLNRTESLILELLGTQEMYGLQLVTESKGKLKRGSVYVTLGRMEEKGYVESRAEERPEHSGMPRRLYNVTGLGQQVFNAWSRMAASLALVRRHA